MCPSFGVSPSGSGGAVNKMGQVLLRTRWGIMAIVLSSARSVLKRTSPSPSSSPCLAIEFLRHQPTRAPRVRIPIPRGCGPTG
eukprot:4099209-Pleurochrysis_carterae.AAC.1